MIAGQLFRLQKNATHEHGVLELGERGSDGSVNRWRKVVDIGELGRAEGKEWEFAIHNVGSQVLGEDGSRMLISLVDAGSDNFEYREIDVETGEVVADGFNTDPGLTTVGWLDLDHILIVQSLTGGPETIGGYPATAYIWERGTPLEEATPVHSIPTTDAAYMAANFGTSDGGHRGLLRRYIDFSHLAHYLVSLDGTVEEVMMPTTIAATAVDLQAGRHLIVVLTEPWTFNGTEYPVDTVLAYDMEATGEPAESRITIVYVLEENEFNPGTVLGGLRGSQSRVYLTTTLEGRERRLVLEYDSPSWRLVQTTPIEDGLHAVVVASGRYTNEVVVSESGYLQPPKFWLESGGDEPTQHMIHQQAAAFNSDGFAATKGVATSKDGTVIDYLLVAPVDSSYPDGELPVLMTGYGGFGMSVITGYLTSWVGGVSIVPWFEAGGALVIAYIRGGGERGSAWHQAAMRENRQLSYDDFIAVAEKLVADGLTAPAHLGVFGMSHGGLLAAVMGTQRPDLFSAVVADVPITDMLRFPLITGANGINEYGDPSDPAMAAILRAYSPFHNIDKGVDYPPFFATVSTNDYRVGAGHARKLIARLKEVGQTDAFLFEASSGGHLVSDPLREPALLARRMAFFLHYLT